MLFGVTLWSVTVKICLNRKNILLPPGGFKRLLRMLLSLLTYIQIQTTTVTTNQSIYFPLIQVNSSAICSSQQHTKHKTRHA